jgi:outer membrane protein assembly factor BamA
MRTRVLRLWCGLCILAACGGAAAEENDALRAKLLEPFQGETVQEIYVRGVVVTSESDILKAIRTRRGRPFDYATWGEDWHRLADTHWFAEIRTTEPIKWPGGVKLTIDVVQNPLLERVSITGADGDDEALHAALDPTLPRFWNYADIARCQAALEKVLRERGYLDATVTASRIARSTHPQPFGDKTLDVVDYVEAVFAVTKGLPARVNKVRINGVDAALERDFLNDLETRRNGLVVAEALKKDRRLIENYFRVNGYADVRVGEPDLLELSRDDSVRQFRVEFSVAPGPQFSARNVSVSEDAPLLKEELARLVRTKSGDLLLTNCLAEDRMRLQDRFAEHGFPNANVWCNCTPVKDPRRPRDAPVPVDVFFAVSTGKQRVRLNFVARDGLCLGHVFVGEPFGPPDDWPEMHPQPVPKRAPKNAPPPDEPPVKPVPKPPVKPPRPPTDDVF